MSTRYRVTIQPRTSADFYGEEIDISDLVRVDAISAITRSIDAGNYNIGVYTFGDMKLVVDNSLGYMSEPDDMRSWFSFTRDLCKVRVKMENEDGVSITFHGLINDEATRITNKTDDVEFTVLGSDSVLRKATIQPGVITDGMTFKNAMHAILNSDEITRVLQFDADNINPDYDGLIDIGEKFEGRVKKDALNDLLFVSNSILLVDEYDRVIVRSRDHNVDTPPLKLYGKGDLFGRENIIDLSEYNSGLHRLFNSIQVNTTTVRDIDSIAKNGTRHKKFTFDWIIDPDTQEQIASTAVAQWKNPKNEMRVTIPTSLAREYDLLDLVSVDHPLRLSTRAKHLPVTDITEVDDTDSPLPFEYGALYISPRKAFKIIEIQENTREFTSTLKLRQIGKTAYDGNFVDYFRTGERIGQRLQSW